MSAHANDITVTTASAANAHYLTGGGRLHFSPFSLIMQSREREAVVAEWYPLVEKGV